MKPSKGTSHYRILVIDDTPTIHEDFRKILLKPVASNDDLQDMESALFGFEEQALVSVQFEIDYASQGKEGLDLVMQAQSEGRPYALAFVDGRMPPGWDGIETISHIWQACPGLQVVLCTAYADYSWEEIRRILGESDSMLILKKPFDNVEVLQLAHALTRKWALNREAQIRVENLDDLVRLRTEEGEQTRFLLEAALEHSPAGIIITDANAAEILWANPAALNICGADLSTTDEGGVNGLCANWRVLQSDGTPHPEGVLPPPLSAVKAGKIIREKEFVLRDAQGQDKWITSNAAPVRDADGSVLAGIVIFQDITERKGSEGEQERLRVQLNQVQKMESVGLLAGGIAHDYNNMMAVILGSVEIALDMVSPSQPINETLKTIQKSARRSTNLTQQLLSFARKQTVAPVVLYLNEKVTDTLAMLHRLIGEDINLLWKAGSGLWPVKIDPSQIDQILINLCINARDAITGVGKITIETNNAAINEADAAAHLWFSPGKYVVLTVTDDGQGIETEHLNRIFEPFYTTKKIGEGTGLGLATVYGIVKQNKGFIHVDSESGNGSTFTIYLPCCAEEITASNVAGPPKKNRNGQGERVLIVEDEEDILDVGKAMLERLGYAVLTARTPNEALRVAEANSGNIDLLMTDVVMPEMNGRDLAKHLLSSQPNLKCLFMSGYSNDIIAQHGVLGEKVHFLQKPFSVSGLAAKAREALDD